MNDFITPIIKLLSSLVSVRAAFRYLFVASGLLLSWVKIAPALSLYNLPGQISGIVTTLFGVGLGTIVSAIIFSAVDGVLSIIKESNRKKLEIAQAEEERQKDKKAIDAFVTRFQKNFGHYDAKAREIIEILNEKERTFTTEQAFTSDTGPEALKGLLNNSVIQVVMPINKHTAVYKINPLLKEWVHQYFYNMHKNNTNEFLKDLNPSKAFLLDIMAERSEYPKEPLPYPKDFFKNPYMFMPCFETNYSGDSTPFYFSFRKDYREHFEKVLDKSFYDEVEVILT
ncbi:hypothetical protein ACJ8LH_11875 [Serratia sp. CY49633]|uniref:hypothetical protein n=1 Tax=Serratia TaxID=613 RepID=UPI001867D8C5|nr:hypothetical protein [Serratia marcescens]CAI1516490.1 Uncharacterised protein [Serratia marcescens]CAI2116191.1 Uncharacterised protein [Serratia marcescens]